MSVVENQRLTFLRLVETLRPHWRRDTALPTRIQALLTRERKFGARDRRLYRELIYTTLRYLPWVERWLDSDPDRAAMVVGWFASPTRDTAKWVEWIASGLPQMSSLADRAAFLGESPAALLPAWMRDECPPALEPEELEFQLTRAPLWLRLQTENETAVADEFIGSEWFWRASAVLPTAWRMAEEVDVTKTAAYATGAIEVQDLGSQLVLASVGIGAGERWLDACAGAGGKTLQLSRLVGSAGHVDAYDVRTEALDELRKRAARADVANIAITPSPRDEYDGVLVDAPCSGSGTWRRSPHLKWITTQESVEEKAALQRSLLHQFARNVRSGGRLVYATCSLARSENEGVVSKFLAEAPAFERIAFANTFGCTESEFGLTILPSVHDTDGFFVSVMRKRQ